MKEILSQLEQIDNNNHNTEDSIQFYFQVFKKANEKLTKLPVDSRDVVNNPDVSLGLEIQQRCIEMLSMFKNFIGEKGESASSVLKQCLTEESIQFYLRAFKQANKELTRLVDSGDVVDKPEAIRGSKIEESCLKMLSSIFQNCTGKARASASLALIQCLYLQQNYQAVLDQSKKTNKQELDNEDQYKLQTILAESYYRVALNEKDENQRKELFNKAADENHGKASLICAFQKIKTADKIEKYKEVIDLLFRGLVSTEAQEINELKNVENNFSILSVIKPLLGIPKCKEQVYQQLLSLVLEKISKGKIINEQNWESYKKFLQDLVCDPNLSQKDKNLAKLILFRCYDQGFSVTPQELKLETTKVGFLGIKTSFSPEKIEEIKKQCIKQELRNLETPSQPKDVVSPRPSALPQSESVNNNNNVRSGEGKGKDQDFPVSFPGAFFASSTSGKESQKTTVGNSVEFQVINKNESGETPQLG